MEPHLDYQTKNRGQEVVAEVSTWWAKGVESDEDVLSADPVPVHVADGQASG